MTSSCRDPLVSGADRCLRLKAPVVIVGLGELGGEFAKGFLRLGHPVVPVLRGMDPGEVAEAVPGPELVLVTVAEGDLHPTLAQIPPRWRDRLVLVQNELTPADWRRHGLENVTVALVWFEKKPGQALTDILFTPVYGPKADRIIEALERLKVKTRLLRREDELIFELARKSLYILTLNIAALAVDTTVGELWHRHQDLVGRVAAEVLTVLERRFGRPLPREALIEAMAEGIADCPDRRARGRRAGERLARVLAEARQAGIEVPVLASVAETAQSPERSGCGTVMPFAPQPCPDPGKP
ncbi:hypothetical protein MIT9_P2610 [Methylomarinovum caldicuralii]|uniref:Ketopantoate reductase n=1 Tax=Methylomarinovum caldicuralii TaxID=438856 RepID=A0AAU9C736_9GAMM|nr:hypothetical protein [Methylomarinovum caldicuralii]BCX83019.1 hypothetical protein MIT9_P2610 [Methylomarinovum caldicuralii]